MGTKKNKNAENQEDIDSKNKQNEESTQDTHTETDTNATNEVCYEEKLTEANDKYLRLSAEFDNYRKRTAREKLDILKSGGENIVSGLLPILDDFDRSLQSIETAKDIEAIKEGVVLIHSKLINYLKSQGLTEIESQGEKFDTDVHDAVTKFPVEDESQKGRIIDVAQKGYKLNDKVIRFAKVIVGE